MPPTYQAIPTLSRWHRDTSAGAAVRYNDTILTNIDELLREYDSHRQGFDALAAASGLYFSIDYWLKVYGKTPTMNQAHAPAVEALYKAVVNTLAGLFHCTVNVLPRELETMFGRELSPDGVRVDITDRAAKYMERARANMYRLTFISGKAFQYPWYERIPSRPLVPVQSRLCASPGSHIEAVPGFDHFAFFAMSMSRDIFMARHVSATGVGKRNGVYHSAYLAGGAAMAAGSMLVEGGVIKAVRSDSGHYHPSASNMVSLLRALQMYGVPIAQINVIDHSGTVETDAPLYLAEHGNWQTLINQYGKTAQDNKDAFAQRPRPQDRVRIRGVRNLQGAHFKIR
jgi:hypothetical protein